MQISRTNLAQLLAANFTEADIAAKLGLEVAVVTQAIAADEYLLEEVTRIRRHRAIDDNLDAIEQKATNRLLRAIDFETDALKLSRIATSINAARRRSQGETNGLIDKESSKGVVELQLPARMKVSHKTNSNGEVIEVSGRALVSKTSAELLKEVRHHEQKLEAEHGGLPKEASLGDETENPLDLL